jgi:hypothetical protein
MHKSNVFPTHSQKNAESNSPEFSFTTQVQDTKKVSHTKPESIDIQPLKECLFSFYDAPITNVKPEKKLLTLWDVFSLITTDSCYKGTTDKLRSITDKDTETGFKKSSFNFVTFSGVFTKRAAKALVNHSTLICIDIDDIDDITSLKQKVMQNFLPALYFVSPRGRGLKVVYQIDLAYGTHLDYFLALEEYFKQEHGVTIDESGKDVSRACFLSYDPDAYLDLYYESTLGKAFLDTFTTLINVEVVKPTPKEIKPRTPDLLTNESVIITNLKTWLDKTKAITFSDGSRNHYITQLAGACNRYGVNESTTLYELEQYAESGFTVDEIRKTIRSIYSNSAYFNIATFDINTPYSFTDDKVEEPVIVTPLLPIDGMPEYLQTFINEYVDVYNTPRDYIAASVIFSTALGIGDKLELKTQYNNVPIIWMALIGNVSAGKTHSLELLLSYFQKKDSEAYKDYKLLKDAFDADRGKPKKDQDSTLLDPSCFQYLLKDYTPETLREVHAINQRGVAVYRDELAGWFSDANRYNKNGSQTEMLSSYYRVPQVFNRIGKAPIHIEKPCIYFAGGIQKTLLRTLAEDNRAENGHLSRMAHVYPDNNEKGTYSNKRLSDTSLTRYFSYLEYFTKITEASVLALSPEAEKVYEKWYNKNAAITNKEPSGYLQGVYGKLDVFGLRFAIVIHGMKMVCNKEISSTISADTMRYALDITEYFRFTAVKVYKEIFTKSDADNIDKKDVIKFLHESGKSQSDIARFLEMTKQYVNKVLKK